jgi:hypothetical protein
VDDFSIFDDLPEDLAADFRKLKGSCLIEGSSLEGLIALVSSKVRAVDFSYAICYLPEEVSFLLSLPEGQAKTVHAMKKRMGGFLEIGKAEHATG